MQEIDEETQHPQELDIFAKFEFWLAQFSLPCALVLIIINKVAINIFQLLCQIKFESESSLSLLFFHLVINTFSTVHSFTAELRVKFFMLKFNFPTPRSKVNIAVAAYEWIYQDDNINNLTNTWNSRVSVLLSILYAFCIHERWEGEITEASNNN